MKARVCVYSPLYTLLFLNSRNCFQHAALELCRYNSSDSSNVPPNIFWDVLEEDWMLVLLIESTCFVISSSSIWTSFAVLCIYCYSRLPTISLNCLSDASPATFGCAVFSEQDTSVAPFLQPLYSKPWSLLTFNHYKCSRIIIKMDQTLHLPEQNSHFRCS